MARPPRYLRPTAEPAERAILTGDPGRALALAQVLLAAPPPMFNHHRGLWGYRGESLADGRPLIVQGAGLGAASHRAVVEDLAGLGVTRMIRFGSCRSNGDAEAGSAIVVSEATGDDGVTSELIRTGGRPRPDSGLTERLQSTLGGSATAAPIHSSDHGDCAAGCELHDLATSAFLATAASVGVMAAAVLVVSASPDGEVDDSRLEESFKTIAPAVAEALADR